MDMAGHFGKGEQTAVDHCRTFTAGDTHTEAPIKGNRQSTSRGSGELLDRDKMTSHSVVIKSRRGRPPKAKRQSEVEERIQNEEVLRGPLPSIPGVKRKPQKAKYAHSMEFLAKQERKRVEREALKERNRELRKAYKDAKRKKKLEEKERKETERLKRKEMKEMLRQQRRGKAKDLVAKQASLENAENVPLPVICVEDTCAVVCPVIDLSIFWKIFIVGKIFLDRWMILDEFQTHRNGVVAYFVVEHSEAAIQGILYAQLADAPFSTLPEEMYFVQTQSERNRSAMFNTVFDARFISATDHWPSFFYAVVLMRESASLHDLWVNRNKSPIGNDKKKAWSLGTVGRLAVDILEAVVSTELKDISLPGDSISHSHWLGTAEYAPLCWHRNGNKSIMGVADCAEVLLYMILDMTGFLPWRGLHKDLIQRYKEQFDKSSLPAPLSEYWDIVRRAQAVDVSKFQRQDGYYLLNGNRGYATCSVLDFRALFTKLRALYKIFGGITEEDAPYDYEIIVDLHSLEHDKREMEKAECESWMIRRQFAERIVAQTKREQATAAMRVRDLN
uniref:ULP_PROTEASE domain-containing protein n=1 Tax=Angiostrongylus cantonensis TaxID=6313 RepID=A0A158PA90_ANGCA